MTNQEWSLETFVDSLVVELDQARETLAVKSVNRPLSYAVKDLSLDLQIFPTYDSGAVRFRTAAPGQKGSSTITLQLSSITDQQIRATSKAPLGRDDVRLDASPIDAETKQSLKRLGVRSVGDIEKLEERNVDLEGATGGAVDYTKLANMIRQARRGRTPPKVRSASVSQTADGPVLRVSGDNLSLTDEHLPVAVINGGLRDVVSYGPGHIDVAVDGDVTARPTSSLILTLDPYCILRFNIENQEVQA